MNININKTIMKMFYISLFFCFINKTTSGDHEINHYTPRNSSVPNVWIIDEIRITPE